MGHSDVLPLFPMEDTTSIDDDVAAITSEPLGATEQLVNNLDGMKVARTVKKVSIVFLLIVSFFIVP
jgi:hypothetical protein